MTIGYRDTAGESNTADDDPLFPWVLKIKKATEDLYSGKTSGEDLDELLHDCISTVKQDARYRNDLRFLKIWFLYLEGCEDFESVYREVEEKEICTGHALLYEWYAIFLEVKGLWRRANSVYQTGLSRKAEPFDRLKEAHSLFLQRISKRTKAPSLVKATDLETAFVNPWETSTVDSLIHKIKPQLVKYDGYHASNKVFPGKANLSSLKNYSRNNIIDIGGRKYQIKGCAGKGSFAQVFKAYIDSNPDEVVALKVQKPPFPWEFHMYRQLDCRIPESQRSSFGLAQRVQVYSDYSILVCDYLSHGTLHDVINSYLVVGKSMEEVLCMYYTIEMLYMLETLHSVGIIHGDFKPDNLLIRYPTENLTETDFHEKTGSSSNQGLCLVDWGRGIDLRLFPRTTEFTGDCRTSGFRCMEMKEKKPWKFQVDTYGLCAIVHLMLHNTYIKIDKKQSLDGGHINLPRTSFKRYWNVDMWKELFTKLLNRETCEDDTETLRNLRKSMEEYICADPKLMKKLNELLSKQRVSLCSS
ncbi:PREDICTED: LOW QUALITY PROTEIN: mitotic checkpoint serine/threonine-protein kinase BUB1 [Camelina sativa]|uniref:LOW QUALITY PROTEIN: mitotic checkpoint serine/threonine-protein kinase BUB1 n=1 Tax=Camelina sativa TaxID=90675 RepID=A0ABM0W9V6_CAMSA|nr:PREDICTED: LOW QUALITY PROTEIN: mitotic checkpoint serine/threonine-protein kinase BUB1 [Camelina sativa]